MKRLAALIGALALSLALAGPALGHQAKSISGTVDCAGNYTITVKADVWGGVHLIVKLDGVVIHDAAENGNDQSVRTFVYTGSGASAGEALSAKTSDQQGSATGQLALKEESCATPTPAPTPTPTPTPSPSSTPTPPPSSTPDPKPTPNITLPPTSTASGGDGGTPSSDGRAAILLMIGISAFAILLGHAPSRGRRSNYRDKR